MSLLAPAVRILAINVTPPISWMLVACNMLGGSSLLMQGKFQGRSDLGWDPATRRSRVLTIAVGLVLLTNAVCVWSQPTVSLRVMVLGVLIGIWRVSELWDYRRRSMRHAARNLEMARRAHDVLSAKGKLPPGVVRP